MRNPIHLKIVSISLLLGLGLCSVLWRAGDAPVENTPPVLLAQASAAQQGGNLAGYVLNQETNLNSVYNRTIGRQLLYPQADQVQDGPLIQYEGPPPSPPPIGPIWQRSTFARPLPSYQGK